MKKQNTKATSAATSTSIPLTLAPDVAALIDGLRASGQDVNAALNEAVRDGLTMKAKLRAALEREFGKTPAPEPKPAPTTEEPAAPRLFVTSASMDQDGKVTMQLTDVAASLFRGGVGCYAEGDVEEYLDGMIGTALQADAEEYLTLYRRIEAGKAA